MAELMAELTTAIPQLSQVPQCIVCNRLLLSHFLVLITLVNSYLLTELLLEQAVARTWLVSVEMICSFSL